MTKTPTLTPPAKPTTAPAAPKPAVAAKPAVVAKPVVVAKPAVVAKPVVVAKPAVAAKPAAPKPAAKPAPKAAAAKAAPATAKVSAPAPTPAPAPSPAKATEAKVVEAKPVETKPVEAKPVEAKPVAVKPVEVKAPVAKPVQAPAKVAPVGVSFAAIVPGEALPKAMQDFAQTGLTQARDAYHKARVSAETLTKSLGTSGEAATQGMQDFSRTLIDAIQTNTDATLGFFKAMAGIRTVSEAVELQARHARTQFETVTEQAKTLAGIANRTVTQTAKPVREAFDSTLRQQA